MKKKLLPILLACMFGLIACGGEKKPDPTPTTDVPVTGVALDQTTLDLMVGDYKTLTATVQPENATNKNVTWSSDNATIASVDNGKVTALAEGSAKITVTTVDGNKTADCTVTVKPVQYSVTITNKADLTAEWARGSAARSLSLEITPKGNIDALINSGDIKVTSSNPDVVAASGRNLTAKGAGNATVTVTYGTASDSVDLTVTGITYDTIQSVVEEVLPHKDDATAYVSGEHSIKGTVTAILGTKSYVLQQGNYGIYIYGTIPDGGKIGSVIGVNSTTFTTYHGLVETKSIGSVEVLPETGETITPINLTQLDDLTFDKQNLLGNINGLTAIGQSEHATTSSYRSCFITDGITEKETYCIYVYKYLDAEVITAINEKLDKLEGKEAGHAYTANLKGSLISVYDNMQFIPQSADEIELIEQTIVNPTAVSFTNTETRLQAGKTLQLTTAFEPENCNQKGLTYTCEPEGLVTVSETGLVTALAAGNVKITATSTVVDTVKAELNLEVFAADYVTEPVVGEKYYLAIDQEGAEKFLYAKDEMSTYYGATTEDKSAAPYAVLGAGTGENEGKYSLKVGSKYFDCVQSGKYFNFTLADEEAFLSFDSERACFYKDFGEGVVKYVGTSKTFTTISWGDEASQTYKARLYPIYETELDASKEYVLGFYQGGTTTPSYYYATGAMNGYYGATDADVTKAATVKVLAGTEENEGKWAIQVGSNYLNITKSGTYINFGYSSSPVYLNWHEFKATPFITIDETSYFAGTYGTYATFSAGVESKMIYLAHLYLKPATVAPTAITVEGADEVESNAFANYTVTVTPTGADASVTWSVENGTGEATISEAGKLTPSKAGTVTVKATSTIATSVVGTKEVTIKEATGPKKGSAENPFTIAEVIEATKDLASGEYYEDGASVYAKGYINSSFTNKGTWCQNVKLADNFGDETTFIAYNPNFTTEVPEVFVGDQVVVCGPIKNYNGTKEFSNLADKTVYPEFSSVVHPEYAISVDSESSEQATVSLSATSGTNGTTFTFTVAVADGYEIDNVKANNKAVTAVEGTYTATIAGPTSVCVATKSSSQKEPTLLAAFTLGKDVEGASEHKDGSAITTYTETVGSYTLTLDNLTKVYGGGNDLKGNGILKLGTSSLTGSFDFTVPSDVTVVRIYVACYKNKASTVTIGGEDFELSKHSDDGEYEVITINTSTVKTVSFASGTSGDKRCCINGIDFLKAAE